MSKDFLSAQKADSLSQVQAQLPAHHDQLPAFIRHNVPGSRVPMSDGVRAWVSPT